MLSFRSLPPSAYSAWPMELQYGPRKLLWTKMFQVKQKSHARINSWRAFVHCSGVGLWDRSIPVTLSISFEWPNTEYSVLDTWSVISSRSAAIPFSKDLSFPPLGFSFAGLHHCTLYVKINMQNEKVHAVKRIKYVNLWILSLKSIPF